MSRAIDAEKAIEIIEAKQKELCPVGRYGRNYVYGSDREKYDAWEEIIDAIEQLPTLTPQPLPPPGKDNNVPTKEQNEPLTPCDVCMYNPPSSMGGKPCYICPASPPEGEEDA